MSRNRQLRQKRLIQALVMCVSALGIIVGLVVRPQWISLKAAEQEISEIADEVAEAKQIAHHAKDAYEEMITRSNELAQVESTMASGDVYSWVVKTFEKLRKGHDVTINQIDPPEVRESQSLPKVPYQEAMFTVTGRATYHSLGTFIANIENTLPYARLLDLEMHAPGSGRGDFDESERLLFKVDISVLVGHGAQPD